MVGFVRTNLEVYISDFKQYKHYRAGQEVITLYAMCFSIQPETIMEDFGTNSECWLKGSNVML